MRSYLALLLLAAGLVACGRESAQTPSSTAAAQSAPKGSKASSSASTNPVDLEKAAKTQQEGADTATSADSSEVALERIAALPPAGQLPATPWVAGTHYSVLSPAQPTDVAPGKVEVIEFFWYACPHCFALDPTIETWRRDKAAYIDFRRVPVIWQEEHKAQARLFFTLKSLGKLDELHPKVFEEIQNKGDLLFVAGDDKATLQAQLKFAKANGIAESDFVSAYNSFGVQSSLQQADDLMRRDKIDSVPTFVINGKYVSDTDMAGGATKLLQLINDLAASEKHR